MLIFKARPNIEEWILLYSIGKVGAIIQLVKYQYFKKLFIKTCSILLHWLYRFNTVKYKNILYANMTAALRFISVDVCCGKAYLII